MGGCGTGKSGIDPSDDASDAAEDVVRGREETFADEGENMSSL
jgi:hypothetical protein